MVIVLGEKIPFSDWQKLELKTAKILKVEGVPNKDKLFRLTIDCGEERTLVAGLKPFMKAEDLQGKTIIVLTNLQPAVIGGIESNGMLLAVTRGDGTVGMLTVDGGCEPGVKVE